MKKSACPAAVYELPFSWPPSVTALAAWRPVEFPAARAHLPRPVEEGVGTRRLGARRPDRRSIVKINHVGVASVPHRPASELAAFTRVWSVESYVHATGRPDA